MSQPESVLVDCGGFVLHARIWNRGAPRTALIWHGVTGTSLDHVPLAEALAARGFQVVAPDGVGCGLSDWARDRATGYGLAALADDARAFLDALDTGPVDWIGTSKGGGLGIRVAGETPEQVRSLILNDVGTTLPAEFSGALGDRLAQPPRCADLGAFRNHVARFLGRNGLTPSATKLDQIVTGWARRMEDGTVGYHYDPALSNQFRHNPEDFALWHHWDAIPCPVLILRGELSHVLSADEAQDMVARNPRARLHLFAGHGHVNFLDEPGHQQVVIDFITAQTEGH